MPPPPPPALNQVPDPEELQDYSQDNMAALPPTQVCVIGEVDFGISICVIKI
jgi:hypothetical protein